LSLLSRSSSFQAAFQTTCMMKFQYHLIRQSNDVGHFKIELLKGHTTEEFKVFALELCVFWSKNVLEERYCPKQILLGSTINIACCFHCLCIWNNGLAADMVQTQFFCFQMTIMKNLVLSEAKTIMLCFYAIMSFSMTISCCKQVQMHLTSVTVIHFENILQRGLAGMIAVQMTFMFVVAQ
jgi:hypothetical protein